MIEDTLSPLRCKLDFNLNVRHDSFQSDGRRVKSTGDEAADPQTSQEISKRAEGTGVEIHPKPSQAPSLLSNGSGQDSQKNQTFQLKRQNLTHKDLYFLF